MLPELPKFLNRKETPVEPSTEERAVVAKPADIGIPISETDAKALTEIEQQQDRAKRAKAIKRIGLMKERKEAAYIADKFRKWDPDTSSWYDSRKGKPKMTSIHINDLHKSKHPKAVSNAKSWDATMTPRKHRASSKPAKVKAREGTKQAKLVALLQRKNGASLAEMLKANPLKGKTPFATLAAMVSKGGSIGKNYTVKHVDDGGRGKDRRFKI